MKDIKLYERVPQLKNNFSVKIRVYERDTPLIPHWHEHMELLFFRRGECEIYCNGTTFTARAGDLAVFNSTEVHSFKVISRVEYVTVLLYPEFFSDVGFCDTLLTNHVVSDGRIREFVESAVREYRADSSVGRLMQKSYMYSLIAYLALHYSLPAITKKESEISRTRLERLDIVTEHVARHYGEKITTRELAKMCYLSEAHFCRFFKSAMGKSATDYVNEVRVERAEVLLKSTSETVSEIAASVGFDDVNYFTRVFKKHRGISPGFFRRNNR